MSTNLSTNRSLRQWLSRLLPATNSRQKMPSGHATPQHEVGSCGINVKPAIPSRLSGNIPRPAPVATKHGPTISISSQTRNSPDGIELDTIQWGQRLNGPEDSSPPTPRELENNNGTSSPISSDNRQNMAITLPSVKEPYMNRWRCGACCIAFFIQGLNDSCVGALLPYMEAHYHVSYAIISLIFVANALGFITAAPFCHTLNNKFGRSKVLVGCTILNIIACVALISQPPYAVVVLAFYVLGCGFATILALDNVFIVNLRGGTALLGYMHGCYGIGGIVAPFAATAMTSTGIRWSYFYLILLVLSMLNAPAFFFAFRGYEAELASTQLLTALERTMSRQTATTASEKRGVLKKSLKNRTTLLGALLIFAYQGAEVSISGWVISFLIDYRNGNPAQVGYVTSGFWGGITLGRFILVAPCHKLGDKISIVALVAGTAAFQFMVWFLPNVIGNAVAVAIIGFLLGPIYPCATGVFSKLLPSQVQITSLGFISSMGSSGGALSPFVTGLLAQKLGTVVLNPICIGLCVVMEVAWLSLPRVSKRKE